LTNSQAIYGCLVETLDPYHPHYIGECY